MKVIAGLGSVAAKRRWQGGGIYVQGGERVVSITSTTAGTSRSRVAGQGWLRWLLLLKLVTAFLRRVAKYLAANSGCTGVAVSFRSRRVLQRG